MVNEIVVQLDDHMGIIQGMSVSRFVVLIKADVDFWSNRLDVMDRCLEQWMRLQRQYWYLEPIFMGSDIQNQLPDESEQFMTVDNFWTTIMAKARKNPNVANNCASEQLVLKLKNHNRQLEVIQKQLERYLDSKRKLFPRFYFISNDEMLRMFSKSGNIEGIQDDLKKIFENIQRVEFDQLTSQITKMFSS